MEQSLELRGHSEYVGFLATARADDGRVLLVSTDTHGSTCVWDPLTGELVSGPIQGDEERTELATLGLGPVELARVSGSAVVPATDRTPTLILTRARKRLRVIDPEADSIVFQLRQPRIPQGRTGPRIYNTAGVRFGDDTSGFAAVRFGGHGVELWAPRRRHRWVPRPWKWRKYFLPGGAFRGALAVLNTGSGSSHLAVNHRRAIVMWDVATRRQVARIDLDAHASPTTEVPLIGAMAPVLLARGPVLAVVVERDRDTGVQICDPYRGQLVGEVFNRHGPPRGGPRNVNAEILALTAVPGPEGTIQVASAGQDCVVRISAPVGKASDQAFTD